MAHEPAGQQAPIQPPFAEVAASRGSAPNCFCAASSERGHLGAGHNLQPWVWGGCACSSSFCWLAGVAAASQARAATARAPSRASPQSCGERHRVTSRRRAHVRCARPPSGKPYGFWRQAHTLLPTAPLTAATLPPPCPHRRPAGTAAFRHPVGPPPSSGHRRLQLVELLVHALRDAPRHRRRKRHHRAKLLRLLCRGQRAGRRQQHRRQLLRHYTRGPGRWAVRGGG